MAQQVLFGLFHTSEMLLMASIRGLQSFPGCHIPLTKASLGADDTSAEGLPSSYSSYLLEVTSSQYQRNSCSIYSNMLQEVHIGLQVMCELLQDVLFSLT